MPADRDTQQWYKLDAAGLVVLRAALFDLQTHCGEQMVGNCASPQKEEASEGTWRASRTEAVRRARWRVMAPKPPKDRGLWTPLASPIWSTLSEGGFKGLSLQVQGHGGLAERF